LISKSVEATIVVRAKDQSAAGEKVTKMAAAAVEKKAEILSDGPWQVDGIEETEE
jgi:hypothetical protein